MKSSRFKIIGTAVKLFVVTLSASLLISSCAKDEPLPEEPVVQDPVKTDPPSFRWKTSAGSEFQADSAFCYVSSNVIYAFRNGVTNSLEFRISSMSSGSYPINNVSGNQLEYQTGNLVYNGTGTLSITESINNKLSGNFECSLSGGTLTGVSGTFISVPKRP